MTKLKCFIACAFGRKNVDNTYKDVIVPTIKELGILPLRVDRISHNKNIDRKIIELIEKIGGL